VRDHATLLAQELTREGASCTFHWLLRGERSYGGSRAEIRAWTEGLVRELQDRRPEVVLLHYSVFTYSHKGVPVFVHPVLGALRAAGVPVVTVLHEFVYPLGYGGWRGWVWALTQRVMLVEVMRGSAAAIATASSRAEWLAGRRWLPKRALAAAPVFSNLPPATTGAGPRRGGEPTIGLFGYAYQGVARELLLDALAELRGRGIAAQLALMGAPGRCSEAGEEWVLQARARELQDEVSFSGELPAQALSDALSSCDVLLFADTAGPSPRKGTLAGALASGRPLVAIDGPHTWSELVRRDVIRLSAPSAPALADHLAALLADEQAADALGARAREFYEREMAVVRTARATSDLIEQVLQARRR
jgi:glycosyltransferase involved in cell wall biosynthesis